MRSRVERRSRSLSGARLLCLLVTLPVWAACTEATTPLPDAEIDFDFPGASLAYARPLGGNVFAIGLKTDTNASTRLWFEFRVRNSAGRGVTFRLEDVGDANSHWSWRQPVASTDDGETWTRIVETSFDSTTFIFSYTPLSDDEWVALSPAYSFARHLDLVDELSTHAEVAAVTEIGRSAGDEPLHHIEIRSQPAGTLPAVWAVARQHPGEPGSSYMIEGFLRWAVSDDPDAVDLRSRAEIHAIPFLNPDGVLAGNQRVNLAGLDQNRQWDRANLTDSPSIYWTQQAILAYRDAGGETRIMLDFHSAPTARANFFFYNDEATSTTPLYTEMRDLLDDIHMLNGDFVPVDGNVARPVQGERVRGWGFVELNTHSLTVESSGNDVTYGPFAFQQLTAPRLLELGVAVGRGILRELY